MDLANIIYIKGLLIKINKTMMSSKLYNGYNQLKTLKLTTKSDTKVFSEYTEILNGIRPYTADEVAMYKLVRNMYNADKFKFLNYIRNSKLAYLVLWTDSKSITSEMCLHNVAYVKWDKSTSIYTVSKFVRKHTNTHPNVLAALDE